MNRNVLGTVAVLVFGLVAFVGWRLSPFHHHAGVAPYKFMFSMQGAFEGREFGFDQVVKCVATGSSGGVGSKPSLRFVQSASYIQFDVGGDRRLQIFVPAMCSEMLRANSTSPFERNKNYSLLAGRHNVIPLVHLIDRQNDREPNGYVGKSYLRFSFDNRGQNDEFSIYRSEVRFDDSLTGNSNSSSGLSAALKSHKGVYFSGGYSDEQITSPVLLPVAANDGALKGVDEESPFILRDKNFQSFNKYWNRNVSGIIWTDSPVVIKPYRSYQEATDIIEKMRSIVALPDGRFRVENSISDMRRYAGNPLHSDNSHKNDISIDGTHYKIDQSLLREGRFVLTIPDTNERFFVTSFSGRTR